MVKERTHCKHGHLWIPENWYEHHYWADGKKRMRKTCKICKRRQSRHYQAKKVQEARERRARLPAPERGQVERDAMGSGTNTGLTLVHLDEQLERDWWNAPAWARRDIEKQRAALALEDDRVPLGQTPPADPATPSRPLAPRG